MNIIEKHKTSIITLCEQHSVKELYAFGSVLTTNFNHKSDVDILVQFEPINPKAYFDNYMNLKEGLESLLNRQIDFVEEQAIKNPIFRKVVDRQKILIYERTNIEVLV